MKILGDVLIGSKNQRDCHVRLSAHRTTKNLSRCAIKDNWYLEIKQKVNIRWFSRTRLRWRKEEEEEKEEEEKEEGEDEEEASYFICCGIKLVSLPSTNPMPRVACSVPNPRSCTKPKKGVTALPHHNKKPILRTLLAMKPPGLNTKKQIREERH